MHVFEVLQFELSICLGCLSPDFCTSTSLVCASVAILRRRARSWLICSSKARAAVLWAKLPSTKAPANCCSELSTLVSRARQGLLRDFCGATFLVTHRGAAPLPMQRSASAPSASSSWLLRRSTRPHTNWSAHTSCGQNPGRCYTSSSCLSQERRSSQTVQPYFGFWRMVKSGAQRHEDRMLTCGDDYRNASKTLQGKPTSIR